MARLRSGILGQMRGKVAGLVGGQWKNVSYIREYVKPANPNTALQQTQRTKMADCVAFAKPIVGPVFNAYTDRFQKSMSGFNRFIKSNISQFDGSPDYSLIKLTEGKLSNVLVASCNYNTGNGAFSIAWTENYGNNGTATDKCYVVVYDKNSELWYYAAAEVTRDTQLINITLPVDITVTNLEAWIWSVKYSGTLVSLISNSTWSDVTAP